MALKSTNQLIHFPNEIHISRVQTHEHSYEIFIDFLAPQQRICPCCGSSHCVVKDSGRTQTVRHIALSGFGTMLTFRRRRYVCWDCTHSFFQPLGWLHPSLHMTSMLYLAICRGLFTVHSLNDIARDNCVTESIVMSVLQSVDFFLPDRLPETLCIDEFHGSTGIYNPARKRWDVSEMHCNVADGDAGCVVDILPSITLDQLTPYF